MSASAEAAPPPSTWIAAAPFFVTAVFLLVAALTAEVVRNSIETRAKDARQKAGVADGAAPTPDVIGDWFEWGSDAVQAFGVLPIASMGVLFVFSTDAVSLTAVYLLCVSFIAGFVWFLILLRMRDPGSYLRWSLGPLTALTIVGFLMNAVFGVIVGVSGS